MQSKPSVSVLSRSANFCGLAVSVQDEGAGERTGRLDKGIVVKHRALDWPEIWTASSGDFACLAVQMRPQLYYSNCKTNLSIP